MTGVQTCALPIYFGGVTTAIKTDVMFEKAKVLDLLNGNGTSIYDYYIDLLNLPVAKRNDLLKDEQFLSNVTPKGILLQVEQKDEFDKFNQMCNLPSVNYCLGLYPRHEGDIILDQFKDLTRQFSQAQTNDNSSNTTTGGNK